MTNLEAEESAGRFKNGDVPTRLSIIRSLSKKGDSSAGHVAPAEMEAAEIGLIIEAMGDSEWQVRKEAVSALSKYTNKGPIILQLLDRIDKNDSVGRRNAAADLFVQWGKASVWPLLSNLKRVNQDTRKVIIDVLGDIGDPRAIPSLLTDILGAEIIEATSADFAVNLRSAALEAIGKIRPPEGVDQVLPFLKKGNPLLTFSAIKALELMGSNLADRKSVV